MKFRYAVIISLLGHGILLMPWPTAVNFSVTSTPMTPYQVTLLKREMKKTLPDKIIEKHSLSNAVKKERQVINEEIRPSIPQQNTAALENKKYTKARAYVISRLNYKIRNNFTYPRLAQRNGWEGKVMLSLVVNAEGNIKNAHIKTGSGYRILDQSALSALIKVKNIKKENDGFNFNHKEIIIPVIYRLQKG